MRPRAPAHPHLLRKLRSGRCRDALYGRSGKPEPVSFSDAYLLWAPRRLPPDVNALIYVNDEMGDDVANLFADIRLIGSVEMPYARERGTRVYLCLRPRASLPEFWRERVLTVSARSTSAPPAHSDR